VSASDFYSEDLAYIHDAGFGDYASRAAPELARLCRRHRVRRGLVVEFGCGSGTVARHLTGKGYRVLGIDQSPAMIQLARTKASAATFRVGSVATTRIPRCDAIIALGEVVSYIDSQQRTEPRKHEKDLASFFTRAFAALNPGGLLVFDFMESAEGRTYDAKSKAGADWAIVMRAEAKGRIVTRDITTFRRIGRDYRRSRETHRVRLHTRQEIATALGQAGFVVTMRRSIGSVRLIRGNVAAVATHNFRPARSV
jgi:SAM-dependent methyltransferase